MSNLFSIDAGISAAAMIVSIESLGDVQSRAVVKALPPSNTAASHHAKTYLKSFQPKAKKPPKVDKGPIFLSLEDAAIRAYLDGIKS